MSLFAVDIKHQNRVMMDNQKKNEHVLLTCRLLCAGIPHGLGRRNVRGDCRCNER